jgi:predicted RNA-binding Zn-ribbon protein involved in translation (DUF1610 family)
MDSLLLENQIRKATGLTTVNAITNTMNAYNCPKCGAEMQEGFLLEHQLALRWIAGKPDTSSWLGDVKAPGREQRQVRSYRCVGCGYLESYAQANISQ